METTVCSAARQSTVSRVTKETNVEVTIKIDGTGMCSADSGIPFLDHMLDQLASHGLFDVTVRATGDLHIDDHHTNEDIGLALGQALAQALGDRKGIHRFGDFSAPLDEALVHVVLDLSGRPHLSCDLQIPTERVGTYDTQLVEHFFQSLVNTSGMTLHIRQLAGKNSHHIIEATFKAFARALRVACETDPRRVNSVPRYGAGPNSGPRCGAGPNSGPSWASCMSAQASSAERCLPSSLCVAVFDGTYFLGLYPALARAFRPLQGRSHTKVGAPTSKLVWCGKQLKLGALDADTT
eukprot:jgi/Mesvir1/4063/Mv10508-RA.1